MAEAHLGRRSGRQLAFLAVVPDLLRGGEGAGGEGAGGEGAARFHEFARRRGLRLAYYPAG